jgi:hypothetical protein
MNRPTEDDERALSEPHRTSMNDDLYMNNACMPRRRALLIAAGVIAGSLLGGCLPWGAPDRIVVERERIERAVAERFPVETRWLGIFDVTASSPTLALLPQDNRIGIDIALELAERLFQGEVRGEVAFDARLRYERQDGTFRLADVRVNRIAVADMPDAVAAQTGRLGALLAERVLDGMVLHTLGDQEQAMLRQQRLQPGAISVTARGIEIALVPEAGT